MFFSGGLPCTIKQEITDSDYEEKYNPDGEGNNELNTIRCLFLTHRYFISIAC